MGDPTSDRSERASAARLRAILDASIAAMFLVRVRDDEGENWLQVIEANQAAADFLHATLEELRGGGLASAVLLPLRSALVAVQRNGATAELDAQLAHPRVRGGAAAQVHGRAVKVDREIALGLVDLTERDALYKRAALDDRLASLGRVAAGVAHEFNNPLAWVIGGIEQIRAGLAEREGHGDLLAIVEEVLEGTGRLAKIVRELRPTGPNAPLDPAGIAVGETIDAAARMAAHRIHRRGHLRIDVDPELPRVIADSTRLAQVLLNLIINSAESLPAPGVGGGNVQVSATRDGDDVVVRVNDDGCGIEDVDLVRVFEPFYSTRTAQGGTGLGLWIGRSIVESFGGKLALRSERGVGTTVDVRLRVAEHSAPRPPAARPPASVPPSASVRLLVLDDEALVARSVVRLLRGYDATIETSSLRALDRIRDGQRFDAVLCDLTMPEMDGFAFMLAAEMLDDGLTGRIIVMSGGTDAETWRWIQERGIQTLDKPFDRQQVRAVLAEITRRSDVSRPPG